jgi:hypothetical protein
MIVGCCALTAPTSMEIRRVAMPTTQGTLQMITHYGESQNLKALNLNKRCPHCLFKFSDSGRTYYLKD